MTSKSEPDTSQLKQAYLDAIRLLSASFKSKQQLRQRLRQKGFTETVTEDVLKKLEAHKLINDETLVVDQVTYRSQGKRQGRNKITYDLKRKGIPEKLITEALTAYSTEDEQAYALDIARARWQKLEKLDVKKKTSRVYQHLISRGFSFDLARNTINQLKNNEDS